MRILNIILEAITSPFTILLRSNVVPFKDNKLAKAWIIFLAALVITTVIILICYRDIIFK